MVTHKIWRASVITLFPETFPGVLGASLIGKGLARHIWSLDILDLKDFAPHQSPHHIDGPPAGGGAGMVMRADISARAMDEAKKRNPNSPLIYLTPSGALFNQTRARQLAQGEGVILFCGRYEGLDQRAIESRQCEEISIGDFVLAGGEVAAQAVLESTIRLLPNILGRADSLKEESFNKDMKIEYPHYTPPREWEGRLIPDILLSGHHQNIAQWRKEQAHKRTRHRRPDLIKKKSQQK